MVSTYLHYLDGYILLPAYLRWLYVPSYLYYVVSYRRTKVLIHCSILVGLRYLIAKTGLSPIHIPWPCCSLYCLILAAIMLPRLYCLILPVIHSLGLIIALC